MSPHYPEMWALLQQARRFDKYASDSVDAELDLASKCSSVYDTFTRKAASYGGDDSPAAAAMRAAAFGRDLYASAAASGEKVASESSALDALEQLGAVAFLDATLKQASVRMSGDELEATQRLQLLGREYGVELLNGLVG